MSIAGKGNEIALDTSDVDRYVGKMVGGGQLKEPFSVTDIRRWVQAMDYPNPIHFEEEAAARTTVEQIIAPQSFTVCTDTGNGTIPAIVGKIPGSHVVFCGDEWWFYGPRVQVGDRIRTRRRFDGYSVAETKFAGPTMFSRGDTLYVNQRKEAVAKQRSTIGRYLARLAQERNYYDDIAPVPEFTREQLKDYKQVREEWVRSGLNGAGPGNVSVGDKLKTRVIGPHSVSTFTTEQRALILTVWGSHYYEDNYVSMNAGWIPELAGDPEADPEMKVGMEDGPASGHTDPDKGKLVGMPRRYGYGSSMGVWVLDYIAYWAGDSGYIRHANITYRSPVFEGDITFLNGEVTDVRFDPMVGVQTASVMVSMTNQNDMLIAKGPVDVELYPL